MSQAFTAVQFADAYPSGAENNWWNLARNSVIASVLEQAVPRHARLIEIGCGTGVVVQALRKQGWDVTGCDAGSPTPIDEVADRLLLETPFERMPQRDKFDAILMFDVLEHIEDAAGFMRSALDSFPLATAVIVTVPARPEAWSAWDDYYGHHRRYLPATLCAELEAAGLKVARTEYFFHSLYVAARLINALGLARSVTVSAAPRPALWRRVVASSLWLESRVLRLAPIPGLSLIAVAYRR